MELSCQFLFVTLIHIVFFDLVYWIIMYVCFLKFIIVL